MLLTRGSAIREHPNVVFLSFLDNSLSDEFTPRLPISPSPVSPSQTPRMIFLQKWDAAFFWANFSEKMVLDQKTGKLYL
ncbi:MULTISPECIES: hypothetical protein [Crocosphaera]|uniref:Uncharacterized protein n=1 Tax=Crocosphaera watsonii WH 0003 TaxID=423471 RepID=G5J1P6_CROWT|nr:MULTISPECIES: hypothetical protein [Crocosphaera]EHJ13890.1 hypothetical protein CWATWH0003_1428 [Crocosphaera watsonii WH 0003]MCH2245522.1 hypothetical protein [Crocosphaera sp.]